MTKWNSRKVAVGLAGMALVAALAALGKATPDVTGSIALICTTTVTALGAKDYKEAKPGGTP